MCRRIHSLCAILALTDQVLSSIARRGTGFSAQTEHPPIPPEPWLGARVLHRVRRERQLMEDLPDPSAIPVVRRVDHERPGLASRDVHNASQARAGGRRCRSVLQRRASPGPRGRAVLERALHGGSILPRLGGMSPFEAWRVRTRERRRRRLRRRLRVGHRHRRRGESIDPLGPVAAIPRAEGRPGDAELPERVPGREIRPLDSPDGLELFAGRHAHVSSSSETQAA